jgi:hypothetical protein
MVPTLRGGPRLARARAGHDDSGRGPRPACDAPSGSSGAIIEEEESMRSQIEFALSHPVFDPERQIVEGHYWWAGDSVSACLTVNIGLE